MAPARGDNDLIKTRREYIHVGSVAASLLLTVLSGHYLLLATPCCYRSLLTSGRIREKLFNLNFPGQPIP